MLHQRESKSQTLNVIINALKSDRALAGLDLTGTELKALAEKVSTDLAENGGRAESHSMADALGGLAGFGENLSSGAAIAGAVVLVSNDLANHDSPNYIAGDAISQVGVGVATGLWAASLCGETGPGSLVCGGVGFLMGWAASGTAGIVFNYTYSKYS